MPLPQNCSFLKNRQKTILLFFFFGKDVSSEVSLFFPAFLFFLGESRESDGLCGILKLFSGPLF